jgi:hypothetical protein
MLDDDQNLNRATSTDPTRRDGMGGGMIALIAAIAVFALLFDGSEHSSGSHNARCTFYGSVTKSR